MPTRESEPIQKQMDEQGQMFMFEPNALETKLLPRKFTTKEGFEVIRTGPIPLAITDENGEPTQSGLVVYDPARFEGKLIDSPDAVIWWRTKITDELTADGWIVVASAPDRIVAIRNKTNVA